MMSGGQFYENTVYTKYFNILIQWYYYKMWIG